MQDIEKLVSEQRHAFGKQVLSEVIAGAPFGSLTKSELEFEIFAALVDSGIIELDNSSNFDIARFLRCTMSKASSMIFQYQMRHGAEVDDPESWKLALLEHVKLVVSSIVKSNDTVEFVVEEKFWREAFINDLKKINVFSDTSFNREKVILDKKDLINHANDIFGENSSVITDAIQSGSRLTRRLKELLPPEQAIPNIIGLAALLIQST